MRRPAVVRNTVSFMLQAYSFHEFQPIAGRRPVNPSDDTSAKQGPDNAKARKPGRRPIASLAVKRKKEVKRGSVARDLAFLMVPRMSQGRIHILIKKNAQVTIDLWPCGVHSALLESYRWRTSRNIRTNVSWVVFWGLS
jgi:hypothetical protein